jgi:membrane protease YdiL (CAAX protease family)
MPLSLALLAGAIAAVWLPSLRFRDHSIPPWTLLFAAAVAAGLHGGVLRWPALPVLAALAGCSWLAVRAGKRALRIVFTLAAAAIAVGLGFHLFPGFPRTGLVPGAPRGASLNFDKAAGGLFLLAAFAPRIHSLGQLRAVLPAMLAWIAVTLAVLFGLAMALGYMHVNPRVTPHAPAWLLANLFFTCVAEEAVFRGLLQQRLSGALPPGRAWQAVGVLLVVVLFALAHGLGAPMVVLFFVGLAGLCYSLAFAHTRCIEAAIAVHFATNAVHFLVFSSALPAR